MSVSLAMSRRTTSPLWNHFTLPDENFRKALCNHCGALVQRGQPDAPRNKCWNRNMQSHITKEHPEIMVEVAQEQRKSKGSKRLKDPRDESRRGTVPLFNLRNQADRADFIKRVCYYHPNTIKE